MNNTKQICYYCKYLARPMKSFTVDGTTCFGCIRCTSETHAKRAPKKVTK